MSRWIILPSLFTDEVDKGGEYIVPKLGETAIIAILVMWSSVVCAQSLPSGIDTTQYSLSMSQTNGSWSGGAYRYFENGKSIPFSGVLYARYANGNYESWQEFSDGLGEGHWINFYEHGEMSEWGTYQQNKVAGPIKKYHPNGVIKAEGNYREWRIRVGEWKYYDESGDLINTENYGKQGDLRDVEYYYQSGQIPKSWYESIIADQPE